MSAKRNPRYESLHEDPPPPRRWNVLLQMPTDSGVLALWSDGNLTAADYERLTTVLALCRDALAPPESSQG